MSEGVDLRPARDADAERLAELSGELGYPSTAEQVRRRFADVRALPDDAVTVAEAPDGLVVGFVHVGPWAALVVDPGMTVHSIVVDERWRGRGIGRELMAWAEEWGRARGLTRAVLRSRAERSDAHRFYQRLGWEVAKTQYSFRRRLDEAGDPV